MAEKSDYIKQLVEEKKQIQDNGYQTVNPSLNVKTIADYEQERQSVNWWKTVSDTARILLQGATKTFEGIVDTTNDKVARMGLNLDFNQGLLSTKNVQGVKDFASVKGRIDDFAKEMVIKENAERIAKDQTAELYSGWTNRNANGSFYQSGLKGSQLANDVVGGIGQMLPSIALAVGTGGVMAAQGFSPSEIAAAKNLISNIHLGLMTASSYGSSIEQSYQNGVDVNVAERKASADASVELLTEVIGGETITDLIPQKTLAAKVGLGALAEGIEESFGEALSPLIDLYAQGRIDDFEVEEYFKNIGYAGLVGTLSSVPYSAAGLGRNSVIQSRYSNISDITEELTNPKGKYTPEQRKQLYQSIRYEANIISKEVSKMSVENRNSYLKETGNVMGILDSKGNVSKSIEYLGKSTDENIPELLRSYRTVGRESSIKQDILGISKEVNETVRVAEGITDKKQMRNYVRFVSALNNLNQETGIDVDYVILESAKKFDGVYTKNGIIYITKNALSDFDSWSKALTHELWHSTEQYSNVLQRIGNYDVEGLKHIGKTTNTQHRSLLYTTINNIFNNNKINNKGISLLEQMRKRNYITEEQQNEYKELSKEDFVKALVESDVLEELTAIDVANMLSDKLIINQFVRGNNTTLKRIMNKIDNLLLRLKKGSAQYNKINGVRDQWLDALKSVGKDWDGKNVIILDRDDKKDDLVVENKDGSINFSLTTDTQESRNKLTSLLTEKGYKNSEIKDVLSTFDSLKDALTTYAKDNGFKELDAYLNAAPKISIVDGKPIMSVLINNGEYQLNFDFSATCKKRKEYQDIIEWLGNNDFFNRTDLFDGNNVGEITKKINDILTKHGIETPCKLCFVESRRLHQVDWARNGFEMWNKAVRYFYGEITDRFNFGQYINYFMDSSKTEEMHNLIESRNTELKTHTKNDKGNIKIKETPLTNEQVKWMDAYNNDGDVSQSGNAAKVFRIVKSLYESGRKDVKLMSYGDLLTSSGLDALKEYSPEFFSLMTSSYGAGTPKLNYGFTPYNDEVFNLIDSSFAKKVLGGTISGLHDMAISVKKAHPELTEQQARYRALKEIAFAIGGIRYQSFSDAQVTQVFDMMQFFSQLAATEMPLHMYTKEAWQVGVLGLMGAKMNMSLISQFYEETSGKDAKFGEYIGGLREIKDGDIERIIKTKDGKEYKPYENMYITLKVDENGNPIIRNGHIVEGKYGDANTKTYTTDFITSEDIKNAAKSGTYLDKDGKPLQSFPLDKAIYFINQLEYSKNVGTIAIGFSEAHTLMLLRNPNIKMVIPYHKSGVIKAYADSYNFGNVKDYTSVQETKVDISTLIIDGEKYTKDSLPAETKKAILNAFNGDNTLYFNAILRNVNDPIKASRIYVERCLKGIENKKVRYNKKWHTVTCKLIPKFYDIYLNEKNNYYKVLADFSLFDMNGKYSPQKSVKWKLPDNYYNEYILPELNIAKGVEDHISEEQKTIQNEILKDVFGFRPSLTESDNYGLHYGSKEIDLKPSTIRYSLLEDKNGNKYVDIGLTSDIQTKITNAKTNKEKAALAENYLKNIVKKINYSKNEHVYISGKDASKITNTIKIEKIRASVEISDLLKASSLSGVKDTPNHKLFDYFFYFDTNFKIGDDLYKATINIGYHKYLKELHIYEINSIKKVDSFGNESQLEVNLNSTDTIINKNGNNVNNNIRFSQETIEDINTKIDEETGKEYKISDAKNEIIVNEETKDNDYKTIIRKFDIYNEDGTINADFIKDYATWVHKRVIHLTTAEDVIREFKVLIARTNFPNEKVKITYDGVSIEGLGRTLFEAVNVYDTDTIEKTIDAVINNVLESNIKVDDGETIETYKISDLDDGTFKENMYSIIKETFVKKSYNSNLAKVLKYEEGLIKTIVNNREIYKETFRLAKQLRSIQKNLEKSKEVKFGGTGQYNSTNGIAAFFYNWFKQFNFTKTNYLSPSNLIKLKTFIENGSFDKWVEGIYNPNFTVEEENPLVIIEEINEQKRYIKELARELALSYKPNRKRMNVKQIKQFHELNSCIYNLYKNTKAEELERQRNVAEKFIVRAKQNVVLFKNNKVQNVLNDKLLEALPPKDIIALICGGTFTDEYDLMYNKLYRDSYERQIGLATDFKERRDGKKNSNIKYMTKNLNKKVKVVDTNGKGRTIPKYALYSYYLNTLSPDNTTRLKNVGSVTFTDSTSFEISIEELDSKLGLISTEETNELDRLFDLYNDNRGGGVAWYVGSMQEKLFGSKSLRTNYYPIVASDSFRIKDFTNGATQMFNVSALNNGRLQKLTNRRTVIEINVNPLILFNNYVDSMTITGEIGLASQELNRILQLKVNGENLRSVISKYIPNSNKLVSSIMNKLIANKTLDANKHGIINFFMGRWATAKLWLNVRSMLKQSASFFTAMGKLGSFSGVKAILSPNTYKTIFDTKKHEKIIENNAVFRTRLYENGAIRGQALSGGLSAFSNGIFHKLGQIGLFGMDMFDRITCYTTFAMCEQYAKITYGYEIGTDENFEKANKMFTNIILETQSNSDRIALSMIRSGEKGQVSQWLFGMFQSDAQNKASQVYDIIIDNKFLKDALKLNESNRKGAKTTEDIDKYNREKAKLEKAKKQLKTETSGTIAGMIMSSIVVVLANIAANKIYGLGGDKDKEEKAKEIWTQLLANTFIDWMPYVNQIANAIEYDGIELGAIENINDFIALIKGFADGNITANDTTKGIFTLLEMFGLGATNISKLISGLLTNFDPDLAIKYKSLLYATKEPNLMKQVNNYIKVGNNKQAYATMSVVLDSFKVESSPRVKNEVYSLLSNGYEVMPKNVISTYTNDDGETMEYTPEQIKAFRRAYNESDSTIQKLITNQYYKTSSEEEKSKMIKKIYDAYYDYSKSVSVGTKTSSKLATLIKNCGKTIDMSKIVAVMVRASSITETKFKTKKELVIQFVNKTNLSNQEKLLVLHLMGYSTNENNTNKLKDFLAKNGFESKELDTFI